MAKVGEPRRPPLVGSGFPSALGGLVGAFALAVGGAVVARTSLWVSGVLLVVLLGALAGVAFYVRRVTGQRDALQVIDREYDSVDAALADMWAAIGAAERHVALIGISHRSYVVKQLFRDAVQRFLARPTARLDIYFSRPGSPGFTRRADSEGAECRVRWTGHVVESIQALRGLKSTSVRLYTYDEYPLWKIVAIDDDEFFVAWYPLVKGVPMASELSKVVRVSRTGSPALFECFETVSEFLTAKATALALPDGDVKDADVETALAGGGA
jgi:hypothetical protein